jgi:hypothetical protein
MFVINTKKCPAMNALVLASILLLSTAMSAHNQIWIFNSGFAQEEIKGEPRSVRVERRDLRPQVGSPPADTAYLQEVTEYGPGGKKAERSIYRPDGTLSYREVYEYASEGHLITLMTFDGTGKEVQKTRAVRSTDTGLEERVVMNADGKELTRLVTRMDAAGRVIESTSIDLSDNSQVHQTTRYNTEGHPVGSEITFQNSPPGLPSRMEIIRRADNEFITTSYGPDGTILTQTETREDNASRESSMRFAGNNSRQMITIEQIESKDAEGNWTKKTIFERKALTQLREPVAEIYRTITYY